MIPDYPLEETLDFKFTTRAFATGIPTTLAGTPVVNIYEDNSTTEITAAETLSVDFDSITGLNNLRVVATAANGFESGKSYAGVITTGTVDGTSVIGEVVAQFSIERSPALRPSVAGRTLGVEADGDLTKVNTLDAHTAQTGDTFARVGAPAGASISADIADVPTVSEFNARTIVAASYALASVATEARLAELDGANLPTDVAANGTAIAALNDLSAANVNSEVVDALNVDTYAEPGQGAPAATASLAAKINYLFKSWRNKKDNDGATTQLYDDAGSTVDQKQTTSESGGTVTKAEWTTGP